MACYCSHISENGGKCMRKEDIEGITRLYCALFGERLKKIVMDNNHAFITDNIHITDDDLSKIHQVIGILTEREQKVLGSRFGYGNEDGQPRTLKQVAEELEVSGAWISQIEHKALRKLRESGRCLKLPQIFQSKAFSEEVDGIAREIREIQSKIPLEVTGEISQENRELCQRAVALKSILRKLDSLPFVLSEDSKAIFKETFDLSGLEKLGLSEHACFMLGYAGISTITELCSFTEVELLKISRIGRRVMEEVKEKLAEKGLSLS